MILGDSRITVLIFRYMQKIPAIYLSHIINREACFENSRLLNNTSVVATLLSNPHRWWKLLHECPRQKMGEAAERKCLGRI